jgi:hypothetical protein
VWRNIRVTILLLVLVGVALSTWLEQRAAQSWKQPLWVGIYPLNGDGSPRAQAYIDALTPQDFSDIESFFEREGHRYGLTVDEPVHVELYPVGRELPPVLEPTTNPLAVAWWSLKVRWFAAHAAHVSGRAPSRVRLFVLYHDPSTLDRAPDSHGLQKGLVGVVHVFADRAMHGSDNIVIAHELLHTAGATDKYDLASGEPVFPQGFADRTLNPPYPQAKGEIMAARRPLSASESEMPRSLAAEVVGPETAAEIRWTH